MMQMSSTVNAVVSAFPEKEAMLQLMLIAAIICGSAVHSVVQEDMRNRDPSNLLEKELTRCVKTASSQGSQNQQHGRSPAIIKGSDGRMRMAAEHCTSEDIGGDIIREVSSWERADGRGGPGKGKL